MSHPVVLYCWLLYGVVYGCISIVGNMLVQPISYTNEFHLAATHYVHIRWSWISMWELDANKAIYVLLKVRLPYFTPASSSGRLAKNIHAVLTMLKKRIGASCSTYTKVKKNT